MKYIILFSRTLWIMYRFWHLYESNNEFVYQLQTSKTYDSILMTIQYAQLVKDCPSRPTPYFLQMTLNPNAAILYTKCWDIANCLQNPLVLTDKLLQIAGAEDIVELEKQLVLYDPSKVPSKQWFSFLSESYSIAEYLFLRPSHTPLYDKWANLQTRIKTYYRTYHKIQYMVVDITDEFHLFHRKFQQAIYTSISIYYGVIILFLDIAAFIYAGDKGIFFIEGLHQLLSS